MRIKKAALWFGAIALFSGAAMAADQSAAILSKLRSTIAMRPALVKPSLVDGVYSVFFEGKSSPGIFVTENLELIGNSTIGYSTLISSKSGVDLDKNQSQALFDEMLRNLPFDRLPVFKYGSGGKRVVLISAYDCPSCRQLEKELSKKAASLDATVYVIPTSLMYADDPSVRVKVKQILCSPDKSAAWSAAVLSGRPQDTDNCDTNPDDYAYLSRLFPVQFPVTVPTAITQDGAIHAFAVRDFDAIFGKGRAARNLYQEKRTINMKK